MTQANADPHAGLKIAILLITDRKGYPLARYAMASILASQDYAFDLLLFCNGWDGPDAADGIHALARAAGRRLIVRPIGADREGMASSIGRSKASKLDAVLSLADTHDRVLYADTDILFFDSLPLGTVDLGGRTMAAVRDFAPVNAAHHYFNSGLMLFDMRRMDPAAARARFAEAMREHAAGCRFNPRCELVDQCPLNIMFADDWASLPSGWNMQACALFTDAWRAASVRHYVGKQKFLPHLPRRADRRERVYLARLAARLGDAPPTDRLNDWLYRLNGIRRLPMRMRMAAAVRSAERARRGPLPARA